jgi:hypothetical protein
MDSKISIWDVVLAPLFLAGACYFIYDSIRDMRRGENRPKVTDDMIDSAFEAMLQKQSDEEMEDMDWLDDDEVEEIKALLTQ